MLKLTYYFEKYIPANNESKLSFLTLVNASAAIGHCR